MEGSFDSYAHVFGFALEEGLGGEDVFYFGSADAECDGTEGSVGYENGSQISITDRQSELSGDVLEVWESPQTQVVPGSYNRSPSKCGICISSRFGTHSKALLRTDDMNNA